MISFSEEIPNPNGVPVNKKEYLTFWHQHDQGYHFARQSLDFLTCRLIWVDFYREKKQKSNLKTESKKLRRAQKLASKKKIRIFCPIFMTLGENNLIMR